MSIFQVGLIFLLIALNAFFVGVEFAVVASRRSRLDLLASPEHPALHLVHRWLEDETARDRLIAASQLGITCQSGAGSWREALKPGLSLTCALDASPAVDVLRQAVEALPLVLSSPL